MFWTILLGSAVLGLLLGVLIGVLLPDKKKDTPPDNGLISPPRITPQPSAPSSYPPRTAFPPPVIRPYPPQSASDRPGCRPVIRPFPTQDEPSGEAAPAVPPNVHTYDAQDPRDFPHCPVCSAGNDLGEQMIFRTAPGQYRCSEEHTF